MDNLCGCGRPVRYICVRGGKEADSCNKYGRCSTWDELYEKNKKLTSEVSRLKEQLEAIFRIHDEHTKSSRRATNWKIPVGTKSSEARREKG